MWTVFELRLLFLARNRETSLKAWMEFALVKRVAHAKQYGFDIGGRYTLALEKYFPRVQHPAPDTAEDLIILRSILDGYIYINNRIIYQSCQDYVKGFGIFFIPFGVIPRKWESSHSEY